MREAASRGFWIAPQAPYGYQKVHVQDGAKKRPILELDPPADAVVKRIFKMVLRGGSVLDITKALNAEGIPSPDGKRWTKTTVHRMLSNEAYTGTLVSPIGGADIGEIALSRQVMKSVTSGGPPWNRTRDLSLIRTAL